MMSMIICTLCHAIFDTDADPDCWVGPNEDLPVCETCRAEDASYENQAHPVKRKSIPSVNFLTGKERTPLCH